MPKRRYPLRGWVTAVPCGIGGSPPIGELIGFRPNYSTTRSGVIPRQQLLFHSLTRGQTFYHAGTCRPLRSHAGMRQSWPIARASGQDQNPAKSDSSLTRRFVMKLHRKFAFAIAVLALAVTLASTASAQWVTKNASFTLPFTANWEGKVLPPGDYTVSVYKLG